MNKIAIHSHVIFRPHNAMLKRIIVGRCSSVFILYCFTPITLCIYDLKLLATNEIGHYSVNLGTIYNIC